MIVLFTCTIDGCPSKDVVHRMLDPMPITVCGGCGIVLQGEPVDE